MMGGLWKMRRWEKTRVWDGEHRRGVRGVVWKVFKTILSC
jgi:hypothetical protein